VTLFTKFFFFFPFFIARFVLEALVQVIADTSDK
jgi:hypothetical protein